VISENNLYLLRHRSGLYLARGYGLNLPEGGPPPYGGTIWRLTLDPMDACRARNVPALWQWIPEHYWDRSAFHAANGPVCACCGDISVVRHRGGLSPYRCEKHADRNPCVVEGCTRTRAANGHLSNRANICGPHWRAYVPPGSPERRAINRLVRLARKAGYGRTDVWPDALENRYWVLWTGIVRRVRMRSTEGHVDEAAIAALFGWEIDA
jgi:hypothetical protein